MTKGAEEPDANPEFPPPHVEGSTKRESDVADALARYVDRISREETVDIDAFCKTCPELENELRQLDVNVNVNWPLVHYKSAVRYLNREPDEIKATGGTNWQKYLPPRFQKRIFYPELWSAQEVENWGKAWVEKVLKEY